MAITSALGFGNGIYDPYTDQYRSQYGQNMSREDYERTRIHEEMRYRQMQAMQQTPQFADKPVLKETQPNPVILLLGNT